MKRLYINICVILIALVASARTPYDEVVLSVIRNNQAIKAEASAESAQILSARAENSLSGPEVEFEHLWAANGDGTRWSASVSQDFQYPGVYRARSQANDKLQSALGLVYESIVMDKALSAKQLVVDIVNVNKRIGFYEEIGRNMHQIGELTQRSYELGNATILDVRKMQLAILDNDRELSIAIADLKTLYAALQGMGAEVPDNYSAWNSYPEQMLMMPSHSADDYLEYKIGQLRSQAAKSQARAISLESVPSLSLGYVHSFEEQTHFNGFTVSIKLPSFSQKKRRKVAQFEAEAVAADYNAQTDLVMAEVFGLYNSASEMKGRLDDYQGLSGDNSYLDLLKRAYDGGELTIIDYLNEINLFRSARLNFIDLEYRYNLALARLNRYKSVEFN